MALLGRFDLSSDFTQFYFWGLLIMMILVVLMTWVAPRGKQKARRRASKVDDRFTSVEGELID